MIRHATKIVLDNTGGGSGWDESQLDGLTWYFKVNYDLQMINKIK